MPHSWLGPNLTRINRRQQRPETARNSIPEANNSNSSSSSHHPSLLPVRTVDANTTDSDDEYYCDGLEEDLEEDYDDGDRVLDLAELAAQVILVFKVSFVVMMFAQKILPSFIWFQITEYR